MEIPVDQSESKRPYRLGVALSGGGVRGFAHLGALYAMDELGIKPDIIAGVSAGALAGAMYASGLSPLDIMKAFMKVKFTDFCEIKVPRNGFFNMDGFRNFLEDTLGCSHIEDCRIPMVICATDIDAGQPVQWRKGHMAERVMASCAIPIVFTPIKVDGVSYVDGGVVHNMPSWAIRNECDRLIGVNVSPLLESKVSSRSLIDIAARSYHLIARSNVQSDLAMCDTIISTDSIADIKVFQLSDKEKAFKSGYRAARDVLKNSPLLDFYQNKLSDE